MKIEMFFNKTKLEISKRTIKTLFSNIWNYSKNKQQKEIAKHVNEWHRNSVVKAEKKKRIEMCKERMGENVKVIYHCPSCKKDFTDYYFLNNGMDIECQECVGIQSISIDSKFVHNYSYKSEYFQIEQFFKDGKLIKEVKIPIENRFKGEIDGEPSWFRKKT